MSMFQVSRNLTSAASTAVGSMSMFQVSRNLTSENLSTRFRVSSPCSSRSLAPLSRLSKSSRKDPSQPSFLQTHLSSEYDTVPEPLESSTRKAHSTEPKCLSTQSLKDQRISALGRSNSSMLMKPELSVSNIRQAPAMFPSKPSFLHARVNSAHEMWLESSLSKS